MQGYGGVKEKNALTLRLIYEKVTKSVTRKRIIIDTTSNRSTGFLLGLVVALAAFYCAMEYRTGGNVSADYDMSSDDLVQDEELLPLERKKDDMIAYLKPSKTSKAITEKIKVVENLPNTDVPTKLDEKNGEADTGLGHGDNGISAEDQNNESMAQTPVATDMNDNPLNLRVMERLPEFPGGMVEFMKWITRQLRYPKAAIAQKLQGTVTVGFIIGKDGTVSEVKIVKGIDPLLDNEAIRVVKLMPKWKPGEENGKPCLTYFCIPIYFNL